MGDFLHPVNKRLVTGHWSLFRRFCGRGFGNNRGLDFTRPTRPKVQNCALVCSFTGAHRGCGRARSGRVVLGFRPISAPGRADMRPEKTAITGRNRRFGARGARDFYFSCVFYAANAGRTHTPRKPRYFPSMCLVKVSPYLPEFFSRNWLNFFCVTGDSRLSSHHLV